jgi:hypothetical protein
MGNRRIRRVGFYSCQEWFLQLVLQFYILDPNSLPDLRTPKTAAEKKTVGCLCCKQGEIDIEFSLPKTGFILGETVNFNICINNRSKKDIEKYVIGFNQESVFKAGSHSITYMDSIENKTVPIFIKRSFFYQSVASLAIPPILHVDSARQYVRIDRNKIFCDT